MPFRMSDVQHLSKKSGEIEFSTPPFLSDSISTALLDHYDCHARSLPWRAAPNTELPDPYHVWLSEIMLQQTTVAAVIPYFHKFTDRWPDIRSLAAARDADIMAAWAGLGYYARARNLLKCARIITSELAGKFPPNEDDLRQLPGVGQYTAAAIAAIAFGQRAVVMDANVERVVARLFAIDSPLPGSKKLIYAATDQITPHLRSGDFAQAMMDLGAGYCSVKKSQCSSCPISKHCAAYAKGTPEAYPVKPAKKAKPVRQGKAYWIHHDGKVLLVTRQGQGMLAGMRALPDDNWSAQKNGDGLPPFAAKWRDLDTMIRHQFTHITLEMHVAVAEGPHDPPIGEYWPVKSLDKAGLPSLFSKIVAAVMAATKSV
jgi:A/G-specific adenine glycosylase